MRDFIEVKKVGVHYVISTGENEMSMKQLKSNLRDALVALHVRFGKACVEDNYKEAIDITKGMAHILRSLEIFFDKEGD